MVTLPLVSWWLEDPKFNSGLVHYLSCLSVLQLLDRIATCYRPPHLASWHRSCLPIQHKQVQHIYVPTPWFCCPGGGEKGSVGCQNIIQDDVRWVQLSGWDVKCIQVTWILQVPHWPMCPFPYHWWSANDHQHLHWWHLWSAGVQFTWSVHIVKYGK